ESPPGAAAVEEREVEQLRAALTDLGDRVDLKELRNATLEEIQGALQDNYHVLHLLGHGISGKLRLTGSDGRAVSVEDQAFAQLALGRRSLRLVVLSACHSSHSEEGGLFAGTGPALIRKRVPAVVAMQYPAVYQSTAGLFSRALYGALAHGLPI